VTNDDDAESACYDALAKAAGQAALDEEDACETALMPDAGM
jgi:hypothetical protein